MKNIASSLFLALSLFVVSCENEEVDTTAPTMEVVSWNPTPSPQEVCGTIDETVFSVTGGDILSFDVIFRDNANLSQYKIDIHSNFDCHGHGAGTVPGIAPPDLVSVTTDWAMLDIKSLTGSEQNVSRELQVPESVTAGNYHFQIQVLDESGNDNPFANFFSIRATNPLDNVAPVVAVEIPAQSSFSASKGSKIRFKGEVTDDRSLSDGGNGVLFLNYTDLSSGNTFNTDQVFAFGAEIVDSYLFDFEYTVPNTLKPGDYRFILAATDGVRNVGELVTFLVEVN